MKRIIASNRAQMTRAVEKNFHMLDSKKYYTLFESYDRQYVHSRQQQRTGNLWSKRLETIEDRLLKPNIW